MRAGIPPGRQAEERGQGRVPRRAPHSPANASGQLPCSGGRGLAGADLPTSDARWRRRTTPGGQPGEVLPASSCTGRPPQHLRPRPPKTGSGDRRPGHSWGLPRPHPPGLADSSRVTEERVGGTEHRAPLAAHEPHTGALIRATLCPRPRRRHPGTRAGPGLPERPECTVCVCRRPARQGPAPASHSAPVVPGLGRPRPPPTSFRSPTPTPTPTWPPRALPGDDPPSSSPALPGSEPGPLPLSPQTSDAAHTREDHFHLPEEREPPRDHL